MAKPLEIFDVITAAIQPHNDLIVARHIMSELAGAAQGYINMGGRGALDPDLYLARERLERAIERSKIVTSKADQL